VLDFPHRGAAGGPGSKKLPRDAARVLLYDEVMAVGRYAPIRDYALLGDGRTTALIARDGSIDWLCLPNTDSPSAFAALLDAEQGGRFELAPDVPFEVQRRYLPSTNVLETTFVTDRGRVRVTDALSLPLSGLSPLRELTRRVDGISGHVNLRWRVEPRFGYGARPVRPGVRNGVPVMTAGPDALALCSWDAGIPHCEGQSIHAKFEAHEGTHALLVLAAAHQEPLVVPSRAEAEERVDLTSAFWTGWATN